MSHNAEVRLGNLTRRELRERMSSGELTACIIPIAAVEQHLEHLAMEHDWRSASTVAAAVAERLRPQVLVAEGIMAGISEHHMRHPGTLTLRPGTFVSVVEDLIDSAVRGGFTNVLVLNGHGGNIEPLRGVFDQFLRRFQVNLQFMSYWDVLTADDTDLLESGREMPVNLPGHAQEFETSLALACFPENVRTEALGDQADSTPSLATAEKGREWFERIVPRVANHIEEMIRGKRVAEIPPFHP